MYMFLQFHPIQFAMCVCVSLRDMRLFLFFFGLHHLTQTPFDSATHSHSLNCLSLSFFYLQTLREFPEELRGDVSMHLHREILQLPIFEAASQVRMCI